MSFGAGAGARGSRPADSAVCPCGSGDLFGSCCGPILSGRTAETPESLMRSRYTAYALGDLVHIAATWHPGTRPPEIAPAPGLRWTSLEIVEAVETGARGAVEFRARWREGRDAGELHERSRFVRQSGQWWYLDGDVR